MPDRTIFSFVVDAKHRFAYEGWQLARSLIKHCGGDPTAIHVHVTPDVPDVRRDLFRDLGCTVHQIARFGDGKGLNKLNQLENLRNVAFERVVLLDTDTVAIGDIGPFLRDDVIMAKPVGTAHPSMAVFDKVAEAVEMTGRPGTCKADWGTDDVYVGHCDGGFYSVPKAHCKALSNEWRKWALWLLSNLSLLGPNGAPYRVDQVSFWLAIHMGKLPFAAAPANVNFFPYIGADHLHHDRKREIALVNYHHGSLNPTGLLRPRPENGTATKDETLSVQKASRQLSSRFDNRLFWDFRYERFPGVGSGPHSRERNLETKHALLRKQGIESAESVLDIGCGDGRVLQQLSIKRYAGIDLSSAALAIARRARPDLEFRLAPAWNVPPADMVLCLDVLTTQFAEADYLTLVRFGAEKTLRTLLISGFAAHSPEIAKDSTLFFHEPLRTTLLRTRRFKRVEPIGAIGQTVTYRCDV